MIPRQLFDIPIQAAIGGRIISNVKAVGSDDWIEVPPPESGGDTSFNNQYLAYEELPADLKQAIEGKSQVPKVRLIPRCR